jgi:hypothetical protein
LYYHDVIRQNVQNDYMEEARTIGALTSNFLDRSVLEVEAQSGRSALINALDRRDVAALDDQTDKINDAMSHYYWVYVTDTSGRVLSSSPYGRLAGIDLNDSRYISGPLRTGKTVAGPQTLDATTGRQTTFVGTPVRKNDTIIGVSSASTTTSSWHSPAPGPPCRSVHLPREPGSRVVFSRNKTDVIRA